MSARDAVRGWLARVGFAYAQDDAGRWRRGSWSQSYTGQRYWPIDPQVDEIHYDDMCIGLARATRYRGLTVEVYTVAEHSVIVSLFVERFARERGWSEARVHAAAQEALLHDGPEAWIGDVARPLKRQRAMHGYCVLEKEWERCVFERFGIQSTPASRALVKEVDNRIVLDEVEALMLDPDMWARSGRYTELEPLGANITALSWEQAAAAFSRRFADLFPEFV